MPPHPMALRRGGMVGDGLGTRLLLLPGQSRDTSGCLGRKGCGCRAPSGAFSKPCLGVGKERPWFFLVFFSHSEDTH